MTAALHFLWGVITASLVVAAVLVLTLNALALTFWPTWAIRQVWCLIDEEGMQRRFLRVGIHVDPNELHHRPTGLFLLLFVSFGIRGLFGKEEPSVYLQTIWLCWVLLIAILTVIQGFAWAFRPRWLARRYPSMTAAFAGSKAGRVSTRITGVLLLLFASLIVAMAIYG